MKVEVELNELELLRLALKNREKKVSELEEKLNSLSEKELNKNAVNLSKRLFNSYMTTVFEELGFSQYDDKSVIYDYDLERELGKDWWVSDRISIKLGSKIIGEFREAFLKIGIITQSNQTT